MKRPWKKNHPASPHKLLDAYVYRLANFTPLDGVSVISKREDNVEPIDVEGFQWKKIDDGTSRLFVCKQQLIAIQTKTY